MKTTQFLLLTLYVMILGCVNKTVSVEKYPVLLISENEKYMNKLDGIEFSAQTRNFTHNVPNHRFISEPLEISQIPNETVLYTKWLIISRFISDPLNYGDRFGHVTRKNCNEEVEFDLLLTEEVDDDDNPTGRWIYILNVAQKPNGKKFVIAKFCISAENEILEGVEYKW